MSENSFRRPTRVDVVLGTEARPHLIRWAVTQSERYSPFVSYALRTTGGWVLVDPEAPDDPSTERLRHLVDSRPVATVLTSDGHERACYQARERWGTPVWGPRVLEGSPERGVGYDGTPDHLYEENTPLPGGLRAIKVAGLWGGDHALLWTAPGGEHVLFAGDLVNGQVDLDLAREDHYRREPGLDFGARPQYDERHPDKSALKDSLDRLLQEEIDLICGAHGTPYRDDPKVAIRRLRDRL
jgi:hypothetical protein